MKTIVGLLLALPSVLSKFINLMRKTCYKCIHVSLILSNFICVFWKQKIWSWSKYSELQEIWQRGLGYRWFGRFGRGWWYVSQCSTSNSRQSYTNHWHQQQPRNVCRTFCSSSLISINKHVEFFFDRSAGSLCLPRHWHNNIPLIVDRLMTGNFK